MSDDLEIKAVRKSGTQQAQQEEEVSSIDWRIIGVLAGCLAFAVVVGFICWNAHGMFSRPTFTKARAEIERKFGPEVADAFDETNRACSDEANLTKACGLLYGEIKKPPVRMASANVQVPQ